MKEISSRLGNLTKFREFNKVLCTHFSVTLINIEEWRVQNMYNKETASR